MLFVRRGQWCRANDIVKDVAAKCGAVPVKNAAIFDTAAKQIVFAVQRGVRHVFQSKQPVRPRLPVVPVQFELGSHHTFSLVMVVAVVQVRKHLLGFSNFLHEIQFGTQTRYNGSRYGAASQGKQTVIHSGSEPSV